MVRGGGFVVESLWGIGVVPLWGVIVYRGYGFWSCCLWGFHLDGHEVRDR